MPEESLTPVTKCEGCVFAKIEDIRTGCDLERHTKLGIISDDKDETFTLKRFATHIDLINGFLISISIRGWILSLRL